MAEAGNAPPDSNESNEEPTAAAGDAPEAAPAEPQGPPEPAPKDTEGNESQQKEDQEPRAVTAEAELSRGSSGEKAPSRAGSVKPRAEGGEKPPSRSESSRPNAAEGAEKTATRSESSRPNAAEGGEKPPTRSESSRANGAEGAEKPPPRTESSRLTAAAGGESSPKTEPEVAAGSANQSTEKSQDWLVFRMCEVYSAPRLPHVMASEWTPIVQSAEHMKFGVCKFGRMAGVDTKDRERWKKIRSGEIKPLVPERPRRPRVPPAPRRVVAKPPEQDLQSESEPRGSAPSPKRSPSATGRGLKREPVECPWCGQMEPPTHPKQCKLRMVDCKYCKQQMELGSLRLHFKGCPARPMVQTESRAPKNSSSNSDFMTLHKLQSTAAHLARQLEASLRRLLAKQPQAQAPEQVTLYMAKLDTQLALLGEELVNLRRLDREQKVEKKGDVEQLQKRLYLLQAQVAHAEQMAATWETVLKAGERSKMHCGVSRLQSSVQTVHRQLDDLTQQAVDADMGDPRSNPEYAPSHLEGIMEAMKEEVTAQDRSQQTLIAQGAAPNMEGLSDLQGRLLSGITRKAPPRRRDPKDSKSGPLPPLSARGGSEERPDSPVEEPPLPPQQQQAQAQADFSESSPLPPDRGPAAMGLREISLDQMREEVDEERKRYIAYHLVRAGKSERWGKA